MSDYPSPNTTCKYCNGAGIIDPYGDEEDVAQADPRYPHETCWMCKGTGIQRPPVIMRPAINGFNPKWQELNKSSCECGHCVGMDAVWKKLCPAGKAAAKKKFKVYPSAYANGWAVQYCRGKFRGKKKK